jgi:hypothetical protein
VSALDQLNNFRKRGSASATSRAAAETATEILTNAIRKAENTLAAIEVLILRISRLVIRVEIIIT